MIKKNIKISTKNGVNYVYKDDIIVKQKPWIGDAFSFLYDFLMKKSVYPKKLDASYKQHIVFLKKNLGVIHDMSVLELATGSGNLSEILPKDNKYVGVDVSPGLLKAAYKKFMKNGYKDFQLYSCSAEDLPFTDNLFNLCICNISLNFFDDLDKVIKEIKRVLKEKGVFFCNVPVPERNKKQSVIHGKLYSESDLMKKFVSNGFDFKTYNFTNGSLLYFKAILKD